MKTFSPTCYFQSPKRSQAEIAELSRPFFESKPDSIPPRQRSPALSGTNILWLRHAVHSMEASRHVFAYPLPPFSLIEPSTHRRQRLCRHSSPRRQGVSNLGKGSKQRSHCQRSAYPLWLPRLGSATGWQCVAFEPSQITPRPNPTQCEGRWLDNGWTAGACER